MTAVGAVVLLNALPVVRSDGCGKMTKMIELRRTMTTITMVVVEEAAANDLVLTKKRVRKAYLPALTSNTIRRNTRLYAPVVVRGGRMYIA